MVFLVMTRRDRSISNLYFTCYSINFYDFYIDIP